MKQGTAKVKSDPESLTDWIAEVTTKKRKCAVCQDQAAPAIREVMQAIRDAGKRAESISVQAIYDRICATNSGFSNRVGIHNFRAHLNFHEPLWRHYKAPKQ